MSAGIRSLRCVAALCLCAVLVEAGAQPAQTPVRGLYNWVHTTFDAERTFAFYREVLGIELAASPFAGVSARPEGIRSVADARGDELVWDLTNTHGSRFRTVFMRASNTPFGLELSEFFDIAKNARAANAWDHGVSRLIFSVRDLDGVVAKARSNGAPVVTLGDAPLEVGGTRAILVRDPDSYLIELRQATAAELAGAEPGEIAATAIGIGVASLAAAEAFYGRLLGLAFAERRRLSGSALGIYGLAGGTLTTASIAIPGGPAVHFEEFAAPQSVAPPHAFSWRIRMPEPRSFSSRSRGSTRCSSGRPRPATVFSASVAGPSSGRSDASCSSSTATACSWNMWSPHPCGDRDP